jgi:riboflavin synthase
VVGLFTGIVRELGEVESLDRGPDGARLRIRSALAGDLREGDSVAVSGVCLTAARVDAGTFEADVMNQTLSLSTLGELGPGDSVNIEPPLRAGDPLGGHLVQGHVDGTVEVTSVTEDGVARRVRVRLAPEQERYLVERGSLTLDGVSLTVAELGDRWAEVSLIPETLERTTLGAAEPGRRLNLELDPIARHVERLVQRFDPRSDA